ncbi:MAG: ATP-binding cassette domain-containing protein [Propionicimonas sp.]|nr:ATP-binding cassette domain-containing protein [Propionicimonas sp.]
MIEVHEVRKFYSTVTAVAGISFTLRDGRITGFLGPNGAGKSTTMRMMAGIEKPDRGRCLVEDQPPSSLTDPMRTLGVLLDGQGAIPGMRARDYLRSVAAPPRIPDSRVDHLLTVVGLDSVSGRRVRTFSLGMKQRLGLAVALLGDPKHLILDEPINGLDPDGVIWIRNLLRQLADEGRCVFLSSHLMSELEQCVDDLVIIDKGHLLGQGPIDAIINGTRKATVAVSSTDDGLLASVLSGAGADVVIDGSRLIVSGLDAGQIGALAHREDLVLSLLAPQQGGLEDAYLSITRGQEVQEQ